MQFPEESAPDGVQTCDHRISSLTFYTKVKSYKLKVFPSSHLSKTFSYRLKSTRHVISLLLWHCMRIRIHTYRSICFCQIHLGKSFHFRKNFHTRGIPFNFVETSASTEVLRSFVGNIRSSYSLPELIRAEAEKPKHTYIYSRWVSVSSSLF